MMCGETRLLLKMLMFLSVIVCAAWFISNGLERVSENICKGGNEYVQWGRKDCDVLS